MSLRGRQTSYRKLLLVGLVALGIFCFSSCGQQSEPRIYDTATNTDNFPEAALNVLEGIETGQVRGYSAVTEQFGELYTAHPELLDLVRWKKVIDRLGSFFSNYADSLVLLGPSQYSAAADYYQLASFAQPDNSQLHHQAVLFDCWTEALAGADYEPGFLTGTEPVDLVALADLTRRFYLGSQNQREFFAAYVQKTASDLISADPPVTMATQLESLPAADQILLALAGFVPIKNLPAQATYADPGLEILAGQAVQIDSIHYQIELYLRPLSKPTTAVLGRATLQFDSGERRVVELRPVSSDRPWQPGSVVPIVGRFTMPQSPAAVLVELFAASAKEPLVTESGADAWELSPETLRWR